MLKTKINPKEQKCRCKSDALTEDLKCFLEDLQAGGFPPDMQVARSLDQDGFAEG